SHCRNRQRNRSPSFGGTGAHRYSYDGLTNKNGQAYSFTLGNQLRSVVGRQWYADDGYGRRVIMDKQAQRT
nr:hypothetical protein [Xanthomonas vasicola]